MLWIGDMYRSAVAGPLIAGQVPRQYAPRYDWQGVSDEAELDAVRARVPGMALS